MNYLIPANSPEYILRTSQRIIGICLPATLFPIQLQKRQTQFIISILEYWPENKIYLSDFWQYYSFIDYKLIFSRMEIEWEDFKVILWFNKIS